MNQAFIPPPVYRTYPLKDRKMIAAQRKQKAKSQIVGSGREAMSYSSESLATGAGKRLSEGDMQGLQNLSRLAHVAVSNSNNNGVCV